MYLPPEERRPWYPFQPEDGLSKRSEAVLLWLIGLFLLSVVLAPIGGSTIVQALLALIRR